MKAEISPEVLVDMFRNGNQVNVLIDEGIPEDARFDHVFINRRGNIELVFSAAPLPNPWRDYYLISIRNLKADPGESQPGDKEIK